MSGGLDLGKTTHRLAAFGTLAGAATFLGVAADGALPGSSVALRLLVSVFGPLAQGFAASFVQADVSSHLQRRISDPEAVLHNHDLQRLVGDTIALVLRGMASDASLRRPNDERAVLEALAKQTTDEWPRVCRWPGIARLDAADLAPVLEQGLATITAQTATMPTLPPVLDVTSWRGVLDHFARHAKVDATAHDALLGEAAVALRARFAHAFREVLKRDFEQDGKAYAGVELLILGELLDRSRAAAATDARIEAALGRIEAAIGVGSGAVVASMTPEARRMHVATLNRLDELRVSVADVGATAARCLEELRVLSTNSNAALSVVRGDVQALLTRFRDFESGPGPVFVALDPMEKVELPVASQVKRLVARQRAAGFVGRGAELGRLRAWLRGPGAISFLVVAGPAGVGKTRLGIEFVAEVRASRWRTGFISAEGLVALSDQVTRSATWPDPTLVVVDYASGRVAELERLMRALAAAASRPGILPLRVLLLDRHRGPNLPWWTRLLSETSAQAGLHVAQWYDATNDIDLGNVAPADRRAIVRDGLQIVAGVAEPNDADVDRVLTRCASLRMDGSPLLLQIATVFRDRLELRSGESVAAATDRFFGEVLARERTKLIECLVVGDGPHPRYGRLLASLVASATLLRGAPWHGAPFRRVFDHACDACERGSDRPAPADARQALVDFLGGDATSVAPFEPDLLGGFWILESLRALRSDAEREQLVAVHLALAPAAVAAVLVRMAQDFPERRPDWQFLEAMVNAGHWAPAALASGAAAMPLGGVSLADLAYAIACANERAAPSVPARIDSGDEAVTEFASVARAAALADLSVRAAALGRREEALAACEESVKHYGGLAAARPDAFLPDLATSLNNVSNHLSDLGRREEALAMCEESVKHRRALVAARPDAFLPDLAMSLNNLSNRLSDLGRREEALAACEESVKHRRALAAARPDAFLPALAGCLNNLSNRLSELGRRENALAASEESVMHHRALAAARPDAFLPALASSLNNLSLRLTALGRREEALEACEESVEHYGALAATRPATFLPDLARALATRAIALVNLERVLDAESSIDEARAITETLASSAPAAFGRLQNATVQLREQIRAARGSEPSSAP